MSKLYEKNLFGLSAAGAELSTRKKFPAAASCHEGRLQSNRWAECDSLRKERTRARTDGLFSVTDKKQAGAKRTLLRRGAGEGNRTPVVSLGSWNSTIELHPLRYAVQRQQLYPNIF